MTKISYSDIAAIPSTVCRSSLDENLEPVDPSNTGHRWDDTETPVTCSECGTQKEQEELCECGNPSPDKPEDTHGSPSHGAPDCPTACDGYECVHGCGTCFCPCHDTEETEAKTTFELIDAYEYEAHFDDEEKAREAYKTFVASGAYGAKLYAITETYENGEPTGDFTDEVLLPDEL